MTKFVRFETVRCDEGFVAVEVVKPDGLVWSRRNLKAGHEISLLVDDNLDGKTFRVREITETEYQSGLRNG